MKSIAISNQYKIDVDNFKEMFSEMLHYTKLEMDEKVSAELKHQNEDIKHLMLQQFSTITSIIQVTTDVTIIY